MAAIHECFASIFLIFFIILPYGIVVLPSTLHLQTYGHQLMFGLAALIVTLLIGNLDYLASSASIGILDHIHSSLALHMTPSSSGLSSPASSSLPLISNRLTLSPDSRQLAYTTSPKNDSDYKICVCDTPPDVLTQARVHIPFKHPLFVC
ncbi:hypothetical protein F4604DRAFT_286071 [Suillus subluteus]|nr:hypothetical protein F4604DRAFT_286071 [Suillus subluteus]